MYVSQNISKGDVFTTQNVRSVRPGLGLHTRYLPAVLGQTSTQDLSFGEALKAEHVQGMKNNSKMPIKGKDI